MLEASGVAPETTKATVDAIAAVQLSDGSIPEFPGGIVNPWNHIEAAMALSTGGSVGEAERAYGWLKDVQREDGAWASGYLEGEIVDHTMDANFCCYVAFGAWHHFRVTRDVVFLREMWPVVDRAVRFTLDLQRPDGAISWARDARGRKWHGALLTSCACIYMSLGAATKIAAELGMERPEWELAADLLRDAIRQGDHLFQPKPEFAMDWYYPVLARALEPDVARERLRERWDAFVETGLGCRCVSHRPWVTAGETAELALALVAADMYAEAQLLLKWIDHLRDADGAYWIGATFPDGTVWPRQKPTWGSASIVLAADALAGGPTAGCFLS